MNRHAAERHRGGIVVLALASLVVPAAPARSQEVPPAVPLRLASPPSFRVYQRDRNGRAEIPVRLEDQAGDVKITNARLTGAMSFPRPSPSNRTDFSVEGVRFEGDRFVDVPAGGPYTVHVTVKRGDGWLELVNNQVFVGDLWVLAGQSNMEGYGNLVDVHPSDPRVMALGMDGAWTQAREPLHWLVDSPDPVHSGDPATRAERSAQQHGSRPKGAGLGLPFAARLASNTRIPIGLIPCAHGGTSMAQWDPSKKGEGGQSLYGSMIRQVGLAGGAVKGVLWYQGESDANPEASRGFRKTFTDFIAAVRADLNQPDLPFYYVQIGCFLRGNEPGPWNLVQDQQRRIAEEIPGTAVISVIDLELDDLIHVGTAGLKRAGERLSKIAQRELFGQIGATTPTFDRVSKSSGNTILVKFKGVNLVANPNPGRNAGNPTNGSVVGLKPDHRIAGFSIRKADGTEIPLIFQAAIGSARDTVALKLIGPIPEGSFLWYGHGLNPYCNLTDGADMAVPVFGPVPLDDVR